MRDVPDAVLDAYYADKFESAYGYDPLEGPYTGEDETEVAMAEHVHWMKTVDKRYLSVGDFDDDKDMIVQIKDVKPGEVTNAQGTQTKQLLFFEGNVKPMVLNSTNMARIAKIVGSGYFDDWVGHKIQLYPDHHVPAFGTITEGVRVREFAPQG